MPAFDSVVVITRRTPLEELVLRFNTRSNARFYQEVQASQDPHYRGGAFDEFEQFHETYQNALRELKSVLPQKTRIHVIEREVLPTYQFADSELVIILGPDGLVVNTAKYLSGQAILAFNPDPRRIDGVLLPFAIGQAAAVLPNVWDGRFRAREVSMARASLADGQSLLAVNDLFIGARTHVSARYRLSFGGKAENQSSSGIIVSTGAGCTGWFQSIVNGSCGLARGITGSAIGRPSPDSYRLDWSDNRLYFAVREPFISRTSQADLVFGIVQSGTNLTVTSQMPDGGVIFSDGVERDALSFNAGTVATIGLAPGKVRLVVP